MKNPFRFFRARSDYETFSASVGTKTRTELVNLTASLRKGNGHPGMLRMVEKRLAKMDGYRGA